MHLNRFLGGSLLALAFLAGCGDTSQPTGPVPTPDQARASQTCTVTDDARAQVRTVTAGCTNAEVTLPAGWTLKVVGGEAAAPRTPSVGPQQITPIENPTPEYVDGTNLIDLSGVADLTIHTSVSDGTQTVNFSIPMQKRSVPNTWGTWAVPPFVEPGTPHILFTQGAQTLTMTLAVPSTIFGFELGPNPFAFHTFTAEFYSGATLVGTIQRQISGDNGARLMAAQTQGAAFDRVVVTGTADFSIGRIRYATGPVQPPIEVPIHRIYSGDPPRAGDTISLADQWVYVEILDVLTHAASPQGVLPFRTANDVRIGASWETGVPAESFALVNIGGNPAQPDFRGRWSRQALQNAGLLPLGQTTLVVWGRDPQTGRNYRGQRTVTVVPPPGVPPACNFNNGGFITHPNGGTGPIAGQHVSMAETIGGISTAGSNALLSGAGPHFRIGDDFPVPAGGCVVSEIITHGYQTGQATPLWTSANLNVRSGSVTGPVVASATTSTWDFSGVYRTFNGVLNNADRPVHRIRFSFPNVTLPAGTYWIDWQVVGAASGWANYRMEPNPANPANPITVFGNGQQMFNAAGEWQPILQPPGAETPFYVLGPGVPLPPPAGAPVATRPGPLPADYSLWPTDRAQ
jgi:hypothetical protein